MIIFCKMIVLRISMMIVLMQLHVSVSVLQRMLWNVLSIQLQLSIMFPSAHQLQKASSMD